MTGIATSQNETGALGRVLVKHARDAFVDQETIDRQWRALNYLGPPDFERACDQSDALAAILAGAGCTVEFLPANESVGMDSIYTRDNAVVSKAGIVLAGMGKGARVPEPAAQRRWYEAQGLPVLGAIEGGGLLEGGDLIWLAGDIVCVGEGYRTNAEGIAQLTRLLGDAASEVITVPLVHWHGENDVFHLMSIISPLADDLALVFSRLLPVSFRRLLLDRGITLVEAAEEEFEAMSCNVLALAPRKCLMLDGLAETRRRLEAAGCEVLTYDGSEISAKGCGGPTCLTRPLVRV